MKNHILTAGLVLAGITAQAQARFGIGPQVGYTLFTTDYHDDSFQNNTGYRSGFAGGLTAEYGVGHLSIRPAVLFAQKGYSNKQTGRNQSIDSQVRQDYVAIPLSIGLTQHSNGEGFQVFGGSYVGYLVGGHYTTTTTGSSSIGTTAPQTESGTVTRDNVRNFDFGLQFGLGYRYQRLLTTLEYSLGLQNADPNNSSSGYIGSPNYYNRGFQLSLAYLLKPGINVD